MTLLLEIESARIDLDGAPLLEGLTARGQGPRLGLLGDWSALFAVLSAAARVTAGHVTLAGVTAEEAVQSGVVGLVPCDPYLPASWNVGRYLVEGIRLGGMGKRAARETTRSVLQTLGLGHLEQRRIETLTLAEKRAVVLALAAADGPPVLAVEDPARNLDENGERLLVGMIGRAAEGRSLVVSARDLPPTGPTHGLFASTNHVLSLDAQTLVAEGTLEHVTAPASRFVVSVAVQGGAFAERLRAGGVEVKVARETGAFAPLDPHVLGQTQGAARLLVELPEDQSTSAIVEAALAVGAPIVELRSSRT